MEILVYHGIVLKFMWEKELGKTWNNTSEHRWAFASYKASGIYDIVHASLFIHSFGKHLLNTFLYARHWSFLA